LSCPGSVDLGVLLPHLTGVIVEEVAVAAGMLLIDIETGAPLDLLSGRDAQPWRTG
jgi:hypothetical protein